MTADQPKDLVVIFVDNSYLETFGAWLDHYKQHDNSKRILCTFAISEHAYEQLHAVFTMPSAQETFGNLGETLLVNSHPGMDSTVKVTHLWVERLKVLRKIINAYPALNVIYTDADAIWLKDPTQLYNHAQHLSSDIVASRGTFPEGCPLGRENNGDGATICFGFTYFRNTPAVRTLAFDMENNVQNYDSDDQETINCVLNKGWISNDPININIDDKSSMAFCTLEDGSLVRSFNKVEADDVTIHNLKVSILPYHQVMRRCDHAPNLDGVIIAHCYTHEKSGATKVDMFDHYGFLRENRLQLSGNF